VHYKWLANFFARCLCRFEIALYRFMSVGNRFCARFTKRREVVEVGNERHPYARFLVPGDRKNVLPCLQHSLHLRLWYRHRRWLRGAVERLAAGKAVAVASLLLPEVERAGDFAQEAVVEVRVAAQFGFGHGDEMLGGMVAPAV